MYFDNTRSNAIDSFSIKFVDHEVRLYHLFNYRFTSLE
jgi:hypothetical protein